jgi:hypothetical protein
MAGVAAGTALPIAVANLFVVLPAACRQVSMPIGSFLRLVCVAPAIGAVPAVLACVAFRIALPPASVLAILVEGAIVGLVYVLAVGTLGLDGAVRSRYAEHARSLFTLTTSHPAAAQPTP